MQLQHWKIPSCGTNSGKRKLRDNFINKVWTLLVSIGKCRRDFGEGTSIYMRFEVLTVLKMLMLVFWAVMTCRFIGRYHCFGEHTSFFTCNIFSFFCAATPVHSRDDFVELIPPAITSAVQGFLVDYNMCFYDCFLGASWNSWPSRRARPQRFPRT
jgi:hypothetical protein